jgi:hypothetical protein
MLVTSCRDSPEAPRGAPVLLEVHWVSPGKRTRVYARDADASVASRVAGNASEIDFVFDRRLDGSRIEDIVGNVTQPKPIPPISVTWPGMTDAIAPVMSEPPFSHQVFYNSSAVFGGTSAYAFLRPVMPGFPSSTTISFTLDRSAFTSAYGEQMDGPDQITVEVDAMTVVPRGAASTDAVETYPPSFLFPVGFSSRVGSVDKLAPFARARAGDVELPVALTADSVDKTVVFVSPAACLGGWPMGAVVDVSFAAGAPDAFGVASTVDQPAGSFRVSGTPAPVDAGCD